jgi:hypothetical protein
MFYFWSVVVGPDTPASDVCSEFDSGCFEIRQPCAEDVPRLFGQVQAADSDEFGSDDFCFRLNSATNSSQFGAEVIIGSPFQFRQPLPCRLDSTCESTARA